MKPLRLRSFQCFFCSCELLIDVKLLRNAEDVVHEPIENKPGGKIQEKVVAVGLDDGMKVEIVSGLNEGETVVVETKTKSSSGASLF